MSSDLSQKNDTENNQDEFILVTSRRRNKRRQRRFNTIRFRRPYSRHRRPPYCGNCGKYGHMYRECGEPFTSLGIIAVRASEHDFETPGEIQNILDSLPDDDTVPLSDLKVLMVQRRDSLGYINILRPRQEEHHAFITTYAQDMTPKERKRLESEDFDTLWTDLSMNKQCRWYAKELERARMRFSKLDLKALLESTISKWNHLEWGFPKGKRNLYEDDLTSALREFQEETGYDPNDLTLISSKPLVERFIGLNNNQYLCKYFVAWMNPNKGSPEIDPDNPYQAGEVSNVAWLSFNDAMRIIRPDAKSKKKVLLQAYRLCHGSTES